MRALSDLWTRLRDTFFGLDLRSLALFRIGLGLTLLVDLAGRCPDLVAHYTDDGVLPRYTAQGVPLLPVHIPISVHMLAGSAAYEGLLFLLAAAVAGALVVGYRTRLATVFSWLLLLSLHERNPLVLHGGDQLERLLLFWSMFLPLGARWSLDARAGPPPRPAVASAATAALLLQVVFLYWFGLAARTDAAWWGQGTAVSEALHLDFYATPLGRWLRDQPPDLLRWATFATVAVEGGGPLLLLLSGGLPRLRTAVIAVMIAFHIMLGLSLRLGTFSLVCAVAWLPFLPAWFWDNSLARLWHRAGRPADAEPVKPAAEAPLGAAPLPPLATAIVLAGLAYVTLFNLMALWGGGINPSAVSGLGLEQSWGMFAPRPNREDGWFVVVGKQNDGGEVDLLRGGPVSWGEPESFTSLYPNMRWAAYAVALTRPDNAAYLPYFAAYLRRHWNSGHKGGEVGKSIEVYYMLRLIQDDGTKAPPRKLPIVRVEAE
jgi:hypothetical protein